jgi:uncharacterized membrane protein
MSSETPAKLAKNWLPTLRSRWWTLLLGVSLMLNLMIGGIIFGDRLAGGPDRLMGASYVQLIPRSFFRELSQERRKQLMQIIHDSREDLRGLRAQFEGTGLKLADVLQSETYSDSALRQTVSEFTTGTESLAARGGDVVVKIVSQLTPEERKLLAEAIRKRHETGRKRRKD